MTSRPRHTSKPGFSLASKWESKFLFCAPPVDTVKFPFAAPRRWLESERRNRAMKSFSSSPTMDPSRAWAPFEPSRDQPLGPPQGGPPPSSRGIRRSMASPRPRPARWAASQRRPAAHGSTTSGDGSPAADFESTIQVMASQLSPESELRQLQAIWLYRMIFTPHPLRERLTLFWHNHFATSIAKVRNAVLMQRQNKLLRSHALSDFKALLTAVGKDPAMLIWLDSTINRKAKPNENYAREVMELFTLGRGHYSEKDVQEAARAFTGWFVVQDQFKEVARQHDDGEKNVLGKTGKWTGDDIPGILIDQPACAEWICRKLFRHFVNETQTPSDALIAPLARAFRDSSYRVEVPVAMILRSNLFHDPIVRRRRVKSPIEFAVGHDPRTRNPQPDRPGRGPGRILRTDGSKPLLAPERRGLERRAKLDQLHHSSLPCELGFGNPLRSERGIRSTIQPDDVGRATWVQRARAHCVVLQRSARSGRTRTGCSRADQEGIDQGPQRRNRRERRRPHDPDFA